MGLGIRPKTQLQIGPSTAQIRLKSTESCPLQRISADTVHNVSSKSHSCSRNRADLAESGPTSTELTKHKTLPPKGRPQSLKLNIVPIVNELVVVPSLRTMWDDATYPCFAAKVSFLESKSPVWLPPECAEVSQSGFQPRQCLATGLLQIARLLLQVLHGTIARLPCWPSLRPPSPRASRHAPPCWLRTQQGRHGPSAGARTPCKWRPRRQRAKHSARA